MLGNNDGSSLGCDEILLLGPTLGIPKDDIDGLLLGSDDGALIGEAVHKYVFGIGLLLCFVVLTSDDGVLVGEALGYSDGEVVSVKLSNNDGNALGIDNLLGPILGIEEGLNDGLEFGVDDGEGLGINDGELLGIKLGDNDGITLGIDDGFRFG